ncbi:MAG: LamG-like jellyroll fold domain-containing protein [Myxococcota bacterium]
MRHGLGSTREESFGERTWLSVVLAAWIPFVGGCELRDQLLFSNPTDASADGDASNAAPTRFPCPVGEPGPQVALYRFDEPVDGRLIDSVDGHHGTTVGSIERDQNRAVCGSSWRFFGGYGQVMSELDFQLASATIDFYVWVPAGQPTLARVAILSKDAAGREDGDMTLWLTGERVLAVQGQTSDGRDSFVCTPPIPAEQWVHVAFGFADELKMWRNGELLDNAGERTVFGAPCEGGIDVDWQFNTQPLVIGASNANAPRGSAEPTEPLNAYLDHLRISATGIDFSLYAE